MVWYFYCALACGLINLGFRRTLLVLNLLHLIFTVVSVYATPSDQAMSGTDEFRTGLRALSSGKLCDPLHPSVRPLTPGLAVYPYTTTEPLPGDSITGILVSRFLFDLQGANRQALHLDSKNGPMSYSTYISDGSLSFARVIGSIGSSIPSTSMYSDYPDFDFASQTSTAEATSSPTLSVVIHITRETTTELGSPDMSTLGSHSVPPAYDDEDAGILSLHARKVTFDDGAVV